MSPTRRICILAACLLVGACTGMKRQMDADFPEGAGLVAQLRSPSSAASGAVHVYDSRNGVQVQLAINNLYPGEYRIAIHERGNCTSPNLFSAGAAWAPPGWTKPPGDLLPGFLVGTNGNQTGYVAHIRGVKLDSLLGKSVVIHWGTTVGEAYPGQPNNRMACGVLAPAKALDF